MPDLIYVPIVHTEADLGTLAKSFKDEYTKKYSRQRYENHVQTIQRMWDEISISILKMELEWHKIRLYQDGLPVCGKEVEIITELAAQGSRNHQLLLVLIGKGAHLEGTENKTLLLEEYQHYQKIFSAQNPEMKNRLVQDYQKKSEKLLRQRDQFVAKRIAQTLSDDETGLLFMGMLHQVEQFLDKTIQVQYLIRRLPLHKNVRFTANG